MPPISFHRINVYIWVFSDIFGRVSLVFVFGGDTTEFLSLVLRKLVFVLAVTLRSYMLEVYVFVFGECLTVTYVVIGTNKSDSETLIMC